MMEGECLDKAGMNLRNTPLPENGSGVFFRAIRLLSFYPVDRINHTFDLPGLHNGTWRRLWGTPGLQNISQI